MSSDKITLELTKREVLGKAVRTLRRNGQVPANMYERGKPSIALEAPYTPLEKVYLAAGKHHPVEVKVDGKTHLAMIKDVDLDPVKGTIRHVAFHAVNRNEKVTAEIPVHIEGDAPAERLSLMVLKPLDVVEVEGKPGDLPDALTVSAEGLAEVGDKLTVGDLKLPEGITLITEPEQTIAYVEEPRSQVAEEAAEAEEPVDAADVPAENGSVETDES